MIPESMVTTTITVERLAEDSEPYEDEVWRAIKTGLPGAVDVTGITEEVPQGSRIVATAKFICDPTDVTAEDRIIDETTGLRWSIKGLHHHVKRGRAYVAGELRRTGEPELVS